MGFPGWVLQSPYIGEESTTSDVEVLRDIKARIERDRAKDAAAAKAVPIEIYSMDLLEAFQKDEDAAGAKFKGKYVVVSGLKFGVQVNPLFSDKVFVRIRERTGWLKSTTTVTCNTTLAEAQKMVSKYGAEQKELGVDFEPISDIDALIKLKGRVTGTSYGGSVELVNCFLF